MQWNQEINPRSTKKMFATSKWSSEADSLIFALALQLKLRLAVVEWNGCFLLADAVHSSAFGFPKLHPRSLLERR